MKLSYGYWLIVVLLLGGVEVARVEAVGYQIEKVGLYQKFQAEEPVERWVVFNSRWEEEWIRIELNSKLYTPVVEDNYHSLALDLRLPEWNRAFQFGVNHRWNTKYQIDAGQLDYAWKFGSWGKVELDLEGGIKHPVAGYESRYQNNWNGEAIAFIYQYKPWDYRLKLSRTDKTYPDASYYTSLKYQLDQAVSYQITPAWELGLSYKEATGDYPFDTSLTRDYWKEEWKFEANYKPDQNRNWQWQYRRIDWDRGFDPYQDNQYFDLKFNFRFDRSRLGIKLSLNNLDYYYEIPDYDPDEAETIEPEEEDYQSRIEQKVAIEYQLKFDKWLWEIELFAKKYDYVQAEDLAKNGIATRVEWKTNFGTWDLKYAPGGSMVKRSSHYQIDYEYKF